VSNGLRNKEEHQWFGKNCSDKVFSLAFSTLDLWIFFIWTYECSSFGEMLHVSFLLNALVALNTLPTQHFHIKYTLSKIHEKKSLNSGKVKTLEIQFKPTLSCVSWTFKARQHPSMFLIEVFILEPWGLVGLAQLPSERLYKNLQTIYKRSNFRWFLQSILGGSCKYLK
jgi:hypothetical protein